MIKIYFPSLNVSRPEHFALLVFYFNSTGCFPAKDEKLANAHKLHSQQGSQ